MTPRCFAADVPVLTPAGLTEISKLRVGDLVHCFDAQNRLVTSAITKTSEARVSEVRTIDLMSESIVTTNSHKWYVAEKGWTRAKSIDSKDSCMSAMNELQEVVASVPRLESTMVYGTMFGDSR